jgi:Zn-dependent peptidase ImmA (M78 family)
LTILNEHALTIFHKIFLLTHYLFHYLFYSLSFIVTSYLSFSGS